MVETQSRRAVTLRTENEDFTVLLKAARRRFPLPDADMAVEYREPAPGQLGSIHETFQFLLDPVILKVILGAGLLGVAQTAGKKILELAIEDGYGWIKDRLKDPGAQTAAQEELAQWIVQTLAKLSIEEQRRWTRGSERRGVELMLIPTDKGAVDLIFHIQCDNRPYGGGLDPLDERTAEIEAHFRPFRLVILPLLRHVLLNHEVSGITILGFVGPAARIPRWQLLINIRHDLITAEIDLAGRVDWKDQTVTNRRVVRRALKASPAFRGHKGTSLFHWKDCQSIAHLDDSDLERIVDYATGRKRRFIPCPVCLPHRMYRELEE